MAKAKLSALWSEASGGFGPYVVVPARGGPVVRRRPVYHRATSPEQKVNEERMTAVAAAWGALTDAQLEEWRSYAARIEWRGEDGGSAYSPAPYNAYMSLGLILARLNPGAPLPAHPPEESFSGDVAPVAVSAGAGVLRFEAKQPNRPGVATELMVQRLVNSRRKPTDRYKGVAFASFAEGALFADVPLEPGAYACAYRFVRRATGQVSGTRLLGKVAVT